MKYIALVVTGDEKESTDVVWLNPEANDDNLTIDDIVGTKEQCLSVINELKKIYPENEYIVKPLKL